MMPDTHYSSRSTLGLHCDALVVGGGPAGLAAGIALRQKGLDVVVADALVPPIDKACGEGLMPDSRRELLELGVDLRGGCEFTGIHFANRTKGRQDLATAEFAVGKGIGVRRVELHRQLIERAEEVGVRLRWGARVELRDDREVRVAGEACRYRYLVGADGEGSRVRRWADLEQGLLGAESRRSQRLGFRRHYRIAPWSDAVEVHWCDLGQAYVTPVADDQVCIAAVTGRRGMHFDSILAGLPYLASKLREEAKVGRDRGAVTTTRRLRRVTRGNVALIGDASGTADAITGSGLASAFREALLLGASLGRDRIQEYESGHAEILRLPRAMASLMISMDRLPGWRNQVIRALAGSPHLFSRLLAVHTGEEAMAGFVLNHGLEVGFRLLWPDASHMDSCGTEWNATAGVINANSSKKRAVFDETMQLDGCQPFV